MSSLSINNIKTKGLWNVADAFKNFYLTNIENVKLQKWKKEILLLQKIISWKYP
jgi:hypothetical protein